MVAMLLEAGADVHASSERGYQAIHAALSNGTRLEILQMLLDAGADPNAETLNGRSPLCQLYTRHKPRERERQAMDLLAAHGARLRFSNSCTKDLYLKNPGILKQVAAPAADLNAPRPFPEWERKHPQLRYRATALWQAAYRQDTDLVRMLLDLGADVDKRDTKRGMTPLQAVVNVSRYRPEKGRPVVDLLLEHGADPLAVALDGTTMADLDDNGLVAAWQATNNG